MWEDFAESFATYVHVVVDKRPWKVIVRRSGEVVVDIDTCRGKERCSDKEQLMMDWMIDPKAAKAVGG